MDKYKIVERVNRAKNLISYGYEDIEIAVKCELNIDFVKGIRVRQLALGGKTKMKAIEELMKRRKEAINEDIEIELKCIINAVAEIRYLIEEKNG